MSTKTKELRCRTNYFGEAYLTCEGIKDESWQFYHMKIEGNEAPFSITVLKDKDTYFKTKEVVTRFKYRSDSKIPISKKPSTILSGMKKGRTMGIPPKEIQLLEEYDIDQHAKSLKYPDRLKDIQRTSNRFLKNREYYPPALYLNFLFKSPYKKESCNRLSSKDIKAQCKELDIKTKKKWDKDDLIDNCCMLEIEEDLIPLECDATKGVGCNVDIILHTNKEFDCKTHALSGNISCKVVDV